MKKLLFIVAICILPFSKSLIAQNSSISGTTKTMSLKECINFALSHNENIKTANLDIAYQKQFKKASTEIPKTVIQYSQGQFNSIYKYDNGVQVTQQIPFPGVFVAHNAVANSFKKGSEYKMEATKMNLIQQLKTTYYSLQHAYAVERLLLKEDSIYQSFASAGKLKFESGSGTLLEKITGESKVLEIKNQLLENDEDINAFQIELQTLMHSHEEIAVINEDLTKNPLVVSLDSSSLRKHPHLLYLNQQIEGNKKTKLLETYKIFPDLQLGFWNVSIFGPANIGQGEYVLSTKDRLKGFIVGMNIPIWFYPQTSRVKAAKISAQVAQSDYDYNLTLFEGQLKQAYTLYLKYQHSIDYYKKSALSNSQLIIDQALKSYNKNEITYVDYLTVVSQALNIEVAYLNVINQNNLAVLKLEYLLSNQKDN